MPPFVHDLFGFNLFFFVKGVRLCVWRTEKFLIWGNNIKNVNFANTDDQVNFIDKMMFYQQSLAGLAAASTLEEKGAIKKLCLTKHDCFSN